MCHSRSNTSRPWQFYALFADRRAQPAEVFAGGPTMASSCAIRRSKTAVLGLVLGSVLIRTLYANTDN